jgi:hypothetical protein
MAECKIGVNVSPRLSYLDWKLGLTKDLGKGFALALAYFGTNAKDSFYTNSYNHNVGNNTAWVSPSKTF